MNKELAKTLTTSLVQFIDKERPEGTMCCSNAECESIEKMFEGDKFDIIEAFIQKKLSRLTEFEQEVSDIVEYCKEHGEHVALDYAKRHARTLLALAKKELLSHADESNPKIKVMTNLKRTYFSNPDKLPKWLKDDIAIKELNAHTKGYTQGYKDAEKFYNDFVAYRNPTMPTTDFDCDGIRCTNPHMDCINCPRKTTGGFYTTCGTSAATLHGNTSATDGKEHNPSFTD